MTQIEKNKEELKEMMEQLGSIPLTEETISALGTCMSAYKALCMICGTHQHREHMTAREEIGEAVPTKAGGA